jgi:hypothetical protein
MTPPLPRNSTPLSAVSDTPAVCEMVVLVCCEIPLVNVERVVN